MATDPVPDAAPDSALYTARVENIAGTSGRVRVHDAHGIDLGAAHAGPVDVGAAQADAPGADATEVTGDGVVVLPTGGPSASAHGFNPEQFLAMAWSTCLGETLRVVLTEHELDQVSSVRVEVGLHRDPAGGYRFAPRALVSIEGLDRARARQLVEAAHSRCPVSKLLREQGDPRVELVEQLVA